MSLIMRLIAGLLILFVRIAAFLLATALVFVIASVFGMFARATRRSLIGR